MKGYFNAYLVTTVAAQCLQQRMCTQVQPTLILLVSYRSLEGKPIRPNEINFLSFRLLGEAIILMLQVQAAIATLLQLHALLPLLVETENLDLAILPFLRSWWDQSMGCTCVHVL